MTFVSYAQNFEDVLLWRALSDVANGCYIDIGAQDPVVDSVSLVFYQAGWRGVHVEPTPAYAAKLRAERPDETVIQAAVSDVAGPLEFFEIEQTGISTGQRDIADHHAKLGFQSRTILVPTVGLDFLMAEVDGDVHWLKVDAEGMEPNVLRSWRQSAVRPWLLVIESTFPNSQKPTHELWIDEVRKRGYREVFFDGLSRYFVHESQSHRDEAFAAPANVFDGFAVAAHHFSASCLRDTLEEAEVRLRNGLEEAGALRRAAEASAAAALESERQVRDQLAAAIAKEAGLLAHMLEAEREHAAATDTLWRERAAADAERSKEFNAATERLQAALDGSRRRDSAARVDLARLEERANALERELVRSRHEHEQLRRDAKEERDLHQQQLHSVQAAEAAARVSVASLTEKADGLHRELARAREEQGKALAELEGDLQRHRSALVRADALIAEARSLPPRTWDRIGRSLGLSGRRAMVQMLSQWSAPISVQPDHATAPNIGNDTHGNLPQTTAPMSGGNPYLRANSLPELLAWDDVDFVRCAYVTVLGRQPDAEGEAYYTDRIRRGHSKMEVLWQLRRSPEGPNHDPGIAGLDRALRRESRRRNRWSGWLASAFFNGEDLGPSARRARALLNASARALSEQQRQTSLMDQVTCVLRESSSNAPQSPPMAAPPPPVMEAGPDEQVEIAPPSATLDSRTREVLRLLKIERAVQCG